MLLTCMLKWTETSEHYRGYNLTNLGVVSTPRRHGCGVRKRTMFRKSQESIDEEAASTPRHQLRAAAPYTIDRQVRTKQILSQLKTVVRFVTDVWVFTANRLSFADSGHGPCAPILANGLAQSPCTCSSGSIHAKSPLLFFYNQITRADQVYVHGFVKDSSYRSRLEYGPGGVGRRSRH
jgi:hypothetical protein